MLLNRLLNELMPAAAQAFVNLRMFSKSREFTDFSMKKAFPKYHYFKSKPGACEIQDRLLFSSHCLYIKLRSPHHQPILNTQKNFFALLCCGFIKFMPSNRNFKFPIPMLKHLQLHRLESYWRLMAWGQMLVLVPSSWGQTLSYLTFNWEGECNAVTSWMSIQSVKLVWTSKSMGMDQKAASQNNGRW